MTEAIGTVLAFWREAGPSLWFARDDAFDEAVRERFLTLYETLAENEHILDRPHPWEATADGALALAIVLDQFPRQIFRGTARAFAADPLARAVARRSLQAGYDRQVPAELRGFFYLPFMHSEDLADQDRCVALYEALGNAEGLEYARIHRDAIARFGRFPHRNPALGRETTPEEQAYLDDGGFSG
ncbi:MAG: DUF924 family protein [Pseudochelatococcus sp.]|jgi:uncharacterized protein (DUF924 family)|uniref:DUF924 family protein n=1 Tax=Pseudochelatococcus sp. TaxID=2020869 RepID=UPI003D9465C7